MVFNIKAPKWDNGGTEPPESLKKDGFVAGYKPPAAYFNWFFHQIQECVKEIQSGLKDVENKSGSTIRSEMTKDEVVNALGFTPANNNSVNEELNRIKRTVVIDLPASGWIGSAAPFSNKVTVAGIKAADEPEVHLYTPKTLDAATVKLRQKMAGLITDGETEDGYITLYCGVNKPTEDFPVLLKGVSS